MGGQVECVDEEVEGMGGGVECVGVGLCDGCGEPGLVVSSSGGWEWGAVVAGWEAHFSRTKSVRVVAQGVG